MSTSSPQNCISLIPCGMVRAHCMDRSRGRKETISSLMRTLTDIWELVWTGGARASHVVLVVKNMPANAEGMRDVGSINSWVGKIPWRRAWQPTPVFLPGEPHGQKSLVGYSPQGHKSPTRWKELSTAHTRGQREVQIEEEGVYFLCRPTQRDIFRRRIKQEPFGGFASSANLHFPLKGY